MRKYRYEMVVHMRRVLVGACQHAVEVSRIGNGYNVRVFLDGCLNQEARCANKSDISWTARNLLRWEDKCGNISEFASSARKRLNTMYG